MNLEKVIHRFASAPHDPAELRRLARALGSELPREQLETLRSFRAELAQTPVVEDEDVDARSYAAGYVASMLDVTAEYETSVQQKGDERTLERMVAREGWRDVLRALCDGPRLPSELASALGEDRSKITRTLQKLRAAGLVQAHAGESPDGRKRPHRLTVQGRRVATELGAGVSDDMARGIRLAVSLFKHLLAQSPSPATTLDTIAEDILGDTAAAPEAVGLWAEEAQKAGLVAEYQGDVPVATPVESSDGVPQAVLARGSEAVRRSHALWQAAPAVLGQINERKGESMPVYVRTSDESWGAWAYALGKLETPGRTIVDGDITSRALEPPAQRFVLLYDNADTLRADREQPTMQAFMERAADKFVVAEPGETADVPEGFTRLELVAED